MPRRLAAACLLVLAACVETPPESADRAAARAVFVESMTADQIPRDVADNAATCFLNRMSDRMVRDLLAATTDAERRAAIDGIEGDERLFGCLLEAGMLEGAL